MIKRAEVDELTSAATSTPSFIIYRIIYISAGRLRGHSTSFSEGGRREMGSVVGGGGGGGKNGGLGPTHKKLNLFL